MFGCLGEEASKKFYNKCSENSRSQIVFRTDIFRKLTSGAPVMMERCLKISQLEITVDRPNTTHKLFNSGKAFDNIL